MLEQKIDELIAVIKEHIGIHKQVLAAQGGTAATAPATTSTKGKAAKEKATAAAPNHSRDEVMALAQDVAQKIGGPAAKKLISDVGGAAKLAEVEDSKLDAVFDAFTKAMPSAEAEEEEEEEL